MRWSIYRNYVLFCVALAMVATSAAAEVNWPRFRGADGSGVASDASLPEKWSTTDNVLWKAEVPGSGWSSPVVWGDKVFVTSFINPAAKGPPKIGFYLQKGEVPAAECQWMVYCHDWKTGEKLWEQVAHRGVPSRPIHPKNSYAAATVSTDGERVYAFFGNVGLFVYTLEGKPAWSKPWGSYPTKSEWGPGASPVLHAGRVYVVDDNEEASFLVAFDAATGNELWRVPRDEKTSWATPFVWTNDQRTELVTTATKKARSYDLDGKLLWEVGPNSSICIPTPVAAEGMLFITSGYEFGDKVRPIFAVKPGAAGDLSPGKSGLHESLAWHVPAGGGYNPSPLVYQGQLYVLYSQGFLAAYNAKTGAVVYGKQRLGGTFTASPWASDGKVFCLNEDGETTVVQAGPEFKNLGSNDLDEVALATPATLRGSVLMRTQGKLWRIAKAAE